MLFIILIINILLREEVGKSEDKIIVDILKYIVEQYKNGEIIEV